MPAAVPSSLAGQTLSDTDTVLWAQQGGFTGADLQIAVAVSFTENSSRKIDAISPVNHDGSRDYGEWQINDKAHADLFTQFPNWWTVQNADMAHAVWSSSGWKAWTTYESGDYQANMDRAAKAIGQNAANPSNVPTAPVDSTGMFAQIGNAMAAIAQGVYKAGAWMGNSSNWVRTGLIVIGGIIVIGTVISTTKNQISSDMGGAAAATPKPQVSTVKTAAKTATKVAVL